MPNLQPSGATTWTARCAKRFHVSPFNNRNGEYHFTFRICDDEVHMGVDLYRDGTCVMQTWQGGTRQPLTNAAIRQHALRHPFDTALNSMPRILWQAAQLYYRKKLPVFRRPTPDVPETLVHRHQPTAQRHVL